VPEQLLTILKFCWILLIWLFFIRVIRVAWVETRAPAEVPAGEPTPEARPRRAERRQARRIPTRLRVVEPTEAAGQSFALTAETVIGRAADCGVCLTADTFVSSAHARVFASDGRVLVEDLGSTNGTFLNAARITEPTPLFRGDRLQIGRTVLEASA